jgi:2-polyprenyl-3-methyl-5-hydroxy-6-metoxy-1,4-benzoquinol methylase
MIEQIKEHWETVYQTKEPHQVSWTQEVPEISLSFIHMFQIPKSAKIIDIGGGDSKLVDHLLAEGYSNITVLDVSEKALEKAQKRLGADAAKVKWIVADVLNFHPKERYDLWHDRAAFHFQTEPKQIVGYLEIVKQAVDGMVLIGTFSKDGPQKCSGLDVQQYDEQSMKAQFESFGLHTIECKREDHLTPSGTVQNFVFCSFTTKKVAS